MCRPHEIVRSRSVDYYAGECTVIVRADKKSDSDADVESAAHADMEVDLSSPSDSSCDESCSGASTGDCASPTLITAWLSVRASRTMV